MAIRPDHPRRLRPLRLSRRVLSSSRHRLRRSQPSYPLQDRREQAARNRHLGHLEDHVPRMRDHLRTDLDQLLPKRRQPPTMPPGRSGWPPKPPRRRTFQAQAESNSCPPWFHSLLNQLESLCQPGLPSAGPNRPLPKAAAALWTVTKMILHHRLRAKGIIRSSPPWAGLAVTIQPKTPRLSPSGLKRYSRFLPNSRTTGSPAGACSLAPAGKELVNLPDRDRIIAEAHGGRGATPSWKSRLGALADVLGP